MKGHDQQWPGMFLYPNCPKWQWMNLRLNVIFRDHIWREVTITVRWSVSFSLLKTVWPVTLGPPHFINYHSLPCSVCEGRERQTCWESLYLWSFACFLCISQHISFVREDVLKCRALLSEVTIQDKSILDLTVGRKQCIINIRIPVVFNLFVWVLLLCCTEYWVILYIPI